MTAHSPTSGATATAVDTVVVSGPVTLAPDYQGAARARVTSGSSVFLPVLLRNASPTARAFSFTSALVTPVAGAGTPRVWSDPDADGSPNDGVIVTESASLAPFGGSQHLLVEIVAGTAATGSVLVVQTIARALDDATVTATEVAEALVGHVGVYRGLARAAGLTTAQETTLFDALQRKAEPEIEALVRQLGVAEPLARMLLGNGRPG